MPRIFTPPDLEYDRTIPKVLIRNCPWTDDQIAQFVNDLSDKNYDIYLYRDDMNDIQWAEGIRAMSTKVYDWNHYKTLDPVDWLRTLDDVIQ